MYFLTFPAGTPDEIHSGLLQKLRGISDIQIVYNRDDADVKASVIALESKSQRTGTLFGYSASLVYSDVCRVKYGTSPSWSEVDDIINSELIEGGTVESITSSIAASLDAGPFERARKSNASLKEYIQSSE